MIGMIQKLEVGKLKYKGRMVNPEVEHILHFYTRACRVSLGGWPFHPL